MHRRYEQLHWVSEQSDFRGVFIKSDLSQYFNLLSQKLMHFEKPKLPISDSDKSNVAIMAHYCSTTKIQNQTKKCHQ